MKACHNFLQPAEDLTKNSNVINGIISLTDLDLGHEEDTVFLYGDNF